MTMFRQIGQRPLRDFGDPLGMLEDCHQRIRSFLTVLIRLTPPYAATRLAPDAADRLQSALKYFREAAPKHTLDEEESLFPRLRRLGISSVETVLGRLEQEHRSPETAHADIDALGQRWLEAGTLSDAEIDRWKRLTEALRAHYEHHIAMEEADLFAPARQLLSTQEQQEIGHEMASRRGLRATALKEPISAGSQYVE